MTTETSSLFQPTQGAGGIELLGETFSLHLNGYYPFSGKTDEEDIYFRGFQGNSLLVQQKIRYALPSADGEIGINLPPPFKQLGLYLGMGGYYLFKQKGFFNFQNAGNVPGARARLHASPADWFTLGVEYTYDKLFKSRFNGFAAFNIPLGPRKLKGSKRSRFPYKKSESDQYLDWMKIKTQSVKRNEIIPFYTKSHRFPHISEEGEPFHFVFVNNTGAAQIGQGVESGTGTGTFEDPYTTLKLADLEAPEDAVVYVFFGDGTTRNYDEGYGFKSGQILSSSGTDLILNGVTIPAFTPNQKAKVTNTSGAVFFGEGVNAVTINGFEILADSERAVKLGSSAVTLRRNEIQGADGFTTVDIQEPFGNSYFFENTIKSGGGQVNGNPVIAIESANGNRSNVIQLKNNTIEAKGGQNAVNCLNLFDSVAFYTNTVRSEDVSGTAFDISSESNSPVGGSYTFVGNSVDAGFQSGIEFDWNSETRNSLRVRNNSITSATIERCVSYNSNAPFTSEGGLVNIAGNTFFASGELAPCIDIKTKEGTADGLISGTVSGNTITMTSAGSAVQSISAGSVNLDIESNTINYTSDASPKGINYQARSILYRPCELTIANNSISTTGNNAEDIYVLSGPKPSTSGDTNAFLQANIDQNKCRTIIIDSGGLQPLCLTLTRNIENIETIALRKYGANNGEFAVFSQSDANVGKLAGLFKSDSQPKGNASGSDKYIHEGSILIVPPTTGNFPNTGCTGFHASYIENTFDANLYPSNPDTANTVDYIGTFWFPYKNLYDSVDGKRGPLNSIIYVIGTSEKYGPSQFAPGPNHLQIQTGQSLIGSASSFELDGVTIPPLSGSTTPIFVGNVTGVSIVSDSNISGDVLIQGISFQPVAASEIHTHIIRFESPVDDSLKINLKDNEFVLFNETTPQGVLDVSQVTLGSWDHTITNNIVTGANTDLDNQTVPAFLFGGMSNGGTFTFEDNTVAGFNARGLLVNNINGDTGTLNINRNQFKTSSTTHDIFPVSIVASVNTTGTFNYNNNTVLRCPTGSFLSFIAGDWTFNSDSCTSTLTGPIGALDLQTKNLETILRVSLTNYQVNNSSGSTSNLPLFFELENGTICVNKIRGNRIKLIEVFPNNVSSVIKFATGSESNLSNQNSGAQVVIKNDSGTVEYIPEGAACP